MSRPRFVTATAVSVDVCEGLEDKLAADGVTPAYLVFEWLVVEEFIRAGKREVALRTPGSQKAHEVRHSGEATCASGHICELQRYLVFMACISHSRGISAS